MIARATLVGWFVSAVVAAALLIGAVFLTVVHSSVAPVTLDLGQTLPAAPAIAAIAEFAPQVVEDVPPTKSRPAVMESAITKVTTDARQKAPNQSALLPAPKAMPQSDFALPRPKPRLDKADKAPPGAKPGSAKSTQPKPAAPKLKQTAKMAAEKMPASKTHKTSTAESKNPAKPHASNGSSAPRQGQKAKGGAATVSPAAYAKAVMKKVRATPKQHVAAKGKAIVGFTVAESGGLAGVKLLKSSGDAALDQIALDHIRRSAPFPVPPEGTGRHFSFEFADR